jgi:DnaD/phage-associated family protein
VTLQCFRLLSSRGGYPRAVGATELIDDRLLATAFTAMGRDFRAEGRRGLDLAVARGTLLEAVEPSGPGWVLLNTAQERRAAAAIRSGQLRPATSGPTPTVADPSPPPLPQSDIFSLYESNIGLITPILAERLQEAETEYPAHWILEAFRIAAEANQRHWRYVEAILERWKTEGKDDGKSGRHPAAARRPADYSTWLTPNRKRS